MMTRRRKGSARFYICIFVMVTSQSPVACAEAVRESFHCGPCLCLEGHVDCSHRGLTSVPQHDLPQNATSLDLSQNRLSHLPDRIFSRFTHLASLDLSNNRLRKLNKDVFVGLENLQQLNLSRNNLLLSHDAYPPRVFRPLRHSLTELHLEGNCRSAEDNRWAIKDGTQLKYPDNALSDLVTLEHLSLDGLPDSQFGPGFQKLTSLRSLSLSGLGSGSCGMNVLRNGTFVHISPRLLLINISDCNVSRIEADTFRPLRSLDTLDLSYNLNLGFGMLGDAIYGLQGSSLRELHVNYIINPYAICVKVTPKNTRYFRNTSLQIIHADYNRIEVFQEGALLNMPDTLSNVSLVGNKLTFGRYFKDFGKLAKLKAVRNNGLRRAPPPPEHYPDQSLEHCEPSHDSTCDERTTEAAEDIVAWSPELKEVGFRATAPPRLVGSDKSLFVLPPNLEVYESRWNKLFYRLLEIHFHPNNSLRVLDLSHNLLTTWYGPITGLNRLESLNLCNNIGHNISTSFFHTLTSLTSFNGSRNFLRKIFNQDQEGRLFEPLVNLKVLDVSSNYIQNIPRNYFKGLRNLETLDLSNNQLSRFDVNITHMKKLQHLDLSYNEVHHLPQSIMDHLDSIAADPNMSVLVDLTYNPLACTCKHLAFLKWIQLSKVLFVHGDHYTCLMSDGSIEYKTDIFDIIKDVERKCLDTTGILAGAVSSCFCLLIAIASALLYRYRWKLRYLYHASRLAYRRMKSQEDAESYEYDAFVSYASEDDHFVHYELRDRLEGEKGLRLNLHNRDFTPGRPIPSNIVAAVQSSRRTLMVLTRQLLASEWCHYELQMATAEAAYTGRDVLLFLLYEEIPSQEMPREVLYDLQASTYIQYPHHADQPLVEDFWTRLAQALKH